MHSAELCPACNNLFFTKALVNVDSWGYRVDCPICGRFSVNREADEDFLDPQSFVGRKLSQLNRARIAHKLRTAIALGPAGIPNLTSEILDRFIREGCPGPTPIEQSTNAIGFVGSSVSETGQPIGSLPNWFFAAIGAPDQTSAIELLVELKSRGLVTGRELRPANVAPQLLNVGLTLDGWKLFADNKKGKTSGSYGFLALKFGDADLEALVKDIIKPTLKGALAFDLVDMRDIARAGVIDNIMRAQIRDAAFVIVDLTHDNSGAYWEAGYAEGLGKPVIYICKKEKFDLAQTHFDTNHCTTVLWSLQEQKQFAQQLVATLRRSMNLF